VVTTHIVSAHESGSRLDHILRHLFPQTPRRVLLRWLTEGGVTLNGRIARKGQVVSTGQEISITPVQASQSAEHTSVSLSILFETDEVVVLDKPSGQASTVLDGGAPNSVASQLLQRYPEMSTVGYGPKDAGLIHRLDTGTSGVLVAARTRAAFTTLTAALRNGELAKEYLAWTNGDLPSQRGTIDVALSSDPRNRRRVIPARDPARSSHPAHMTRYEVLRVENGIALVRVQAPVATRHQIRAHFAAVGCPLLGDTLYGGTAYPGLTRHALHALQVSYRGAMGCSAFDCMSAPPEDVRALVPLDLVE
jgi:23S rRNA pseudouridine1911/1915/1917 synthase